MSEENIVTAIARTALDELASIQEIDRLRSTLADAQKTIHQLQREEYVKSAAAVIIGLGSRLTAAEDRIKELEVALAPFAEMPDSELPWLPSGAKKYLVARQVMKGKR